MKFTARRSFAWLALALILAAPVKMALASDTWSGWISTAPANAEYRWRSVFNGYAGEHKEIQFRNRSNETLAFTWTAWSDSGKGSDGSSIALQPNSISDTHSFQLKGDITSVSTTHWVPGQSSTQEDSTRTAWNVMEVRFAPSPASTQTQATPDKASIEDWISNQMTSRNMNQIPIRYSYSEDDDRGEFTDDVTAVGFVKIDRFVLSSCHLEISVDWRVDRTKVTTLTKLGRQKPERDADVMSYSISVDLKNIQPSTVSDQRFDFSARKYWETANVSCESPAPDCKAEAVFATAKGDDVQLLSNTKLVGIRSLQIPISTATDGPRIVRALHDEVIACGGKDINKDLY